MAQRIYKYATIFGVQITGLKNLWEPSTSYRGQPTQKPNYITSVIIPKRAAHWSQEPVMAGFTAACMELYQAAMSRIPFEQVVWPVKDGDLPPEAGKPPIEWTRGHWFLSASSSSPINVDLVQNGQPVKLTNRAQVKAGDYVTLSGALAVKTNDPRGVKFYGNNVLFMNPGEEIAIGNGVTGAQLMEQARAQGLNITGFTPGHAGGFGAPSPAQFPALQTPGAPGFTQPAPAGFGAPTPPSNGFAPPPAQPPGQGGFAPPPNGFAPPR